MIICPAYWHTAKNYLSDRDQYLAQIIDEFPNDMLMGKKDAFFTLARSIIGQQISVKAADSIWERLLKLTLEITPAKIMSCSENNYRQIGLSKQKINYLRNIAKFFIQNQYGVDSLFYMDHDQLSKDLLAIKGIGNWTVEMFRIFYLLDPDIFPLKDIGLINAMKKIYNIDTREEIISVADKWQPYRTVATWYLWRSLDPVPVEY